MLEINSLKKKYKSFSLDCSLSVGRGEIVGLIGQNGAGKSTTFKAVLGLISSDGGEIKLFEKNICDITTEDRERIGVVLSDSGFSGYLSAKDLIPILKGFYKSFDPSAFREALSRFGLPLDKLIKEYSSGMKAKLKLLCALSHGAELLILDEPTAGLDVVARDELLLMLREYMEEDERRSILISSHISADLESLCDRIYMINGGRVILHEDTDVLLSSYAVLKLDEKQYSEIDKEYIIRVKREPYGYSCLTDQRKFYLENYPGITVENATIDSIVMLTVKGEAR